METEQLQDMLRRRSCLNLGVKDACEAGEGEVRMMLLLKRKGKLLWVK